MTASLVGALLVVGAPTFAFGEGDATHQAKANSVAAQKAKDDDNKKAADDKKANDNKKADPPKKADDNKKADPPKKSGDDKKAADPPKKSGDDNKQADPPKKGDDNKQAGDRNRHDNGKNDNNKAKDTDARDHKRADDDKKSNDSHRDDWKNKNHDDNWDKNWDRNHHRHDWDTHRHYYRYGYYGPGWYDDCGYYSPGYDGYNDNYNYYGPDACGYEYGGYQSHFLVDMSWDQEVPRPGPDGAVGTANIDIDVPAGRLCFRLAYDGIDRAIGAQIHPGRLGEGGPNLVLLHVGENGDDGCVGVDPQILSEIQNDPRGYYLEVDDQNGPAMRGQLDAPDYRNRY
jgi:hypothetical protein